MVTGIVIPHETRLEVFAHEFTDLTSYQAVVGGYIEPIRQSDDRLGAAALQVREGQRTELRDKVSDQFRLHILSLGGWSFFPTH